MWVVFPSSCNVTSSKKKFESLISALSQQCKISWTVTVPQSKDQTRWYLYTSLHPTLGTRYASECKNFSSLRGVQWCTHLLLQNISHGDPQQNPKIKHISISAVKIMTIYLGIIKCINGPTWRFFSQMNYRDIFFHFSDLNFR
jgi:hypothetical protein